MELTTAQRATLKTAIEAEPSLATALAQGNDVAVADWCNETTTFVVWRTAVPTEEIQDATNWTEFIGRSQGERDAYRILVDRDRVNPSLATIRQAFNDIFSGATGAISRPAIRTAFQRTATRAEQLLATGTGTTATPAQLRAEGSVTSSDVAAILRG
jgi:hypothetical protein